MKKFNFDAEYISYWKKRIGSLADGSRVADAKIISFFLNKLRIKPEDVLLDLGCGHGRLFPLLSRYSKKIIGLDVNPDAINLACSYPYQCLVKGTAEETNFAAGYFDKIIAWAVYDVVEQRRALIEQNRILKNSGCLLITGKNIKYAKDDKDAFIAERNAKLKDFPNHFTDVKKLLRLSRTFGFSLVKSYVFPKRGDLGRMVFVDFQKETIPCFYEFLLILRKTGNAVSLPAQVCTEYSETAIRFAEENNFTDIKKFFRWHKKKYGND